MALEPLQLDNATWPQLVETARRRIAAASRSQWTLHSAVDPGVTLLELFAWLLEQRSYTLDQLAPESFRELLGLLGHVVRRARPAATVLCFDVGGNAGVPAGSVLEVRRRGKAPLAYTTERNLAIAPVVTDNPVRIVVGGVDRSVELGVTTIELVTVGGRWHVELALVVEKPLDPKVYPLGMLVQLETSPDILPEWHPEATRTPNGEDVAAVPPPANLEWTYASTSGWKRFAADAIVDGTAGLRRSGVLAISVADDWEPDGAGPFTYRIAISTSAPTFTYPPRVIDIVANATLARQRRVVHQEYSFTREESLPIAGWLQIPLDADDPPLREMVQLTLVERDGNARDWAAADHLAASGPGTRAFVVDRAKRLVTFGDGLAGRIPTLTPSEDLNPPRPNVSAVFQTSAGVAGNIGARASFENPEHKWRAVNPTPTIGGLDDEAIEDARLRSAADLKQVTRAVLARDYVELARTTPGAGIERADAAIGVHPGFKCAVVPGAVTVYVLPFAPRPAPEADESDWDLDWVWAPMPDPGALAAVRDRLDAARLVATELYVCPPVYRDVSLDITLRGDPPDPDALATKLRRRLQQFLDPLIGGDRRAGWPFGEPLRPSALLREAQAAIGDLADVIRVHVSVPGSQTASECSDVAIGPHELVRLRAVTVELDRVVGTSGGLR